MTDTNDKKGVAVQTAKAGGITTTLLLALTQLPQPYAQWVEYALIGIAIVGLAATQIPAPADGGKLMPVYKLLSILAANWGQAANAALALRGKNTSPNTSKPTSPT